MKRWTVYNYNDNSVIGSVWGDSPATALEAARLEYGGDVYVLPEATG